MLGAKIEWVRELLRYCTGRATLRAYDTPAHIFADDKDGVKVSKYDGKRFIRTLTHVPGLSRTRRGSSDCNSRERLGRGLD